MMVPYGDDKFHNTSELGLRWCISELNRDVRDQGAF